MNLEQRQITNSETQRQKRNATLIGLVIAITLAGAVVYALAIGSTDQIWSLLPILTASVILIWLSRTGRHLAGGTLLIGVVAIQAIIAPLSESGLGIPNAVGAIALIGGIGLAIMPRQYFERVLLIGLIVSISSILIDLFGSMNRPASASIQELWIFSIVVFVIFAIIFMREFLSLDIRTKIILGVLGTGGVTLAVVALFAVSRTQVIVGSLSDRLETSVSLLAEEQLITTAGAQTDQIDQFFNEIANDVEGLADYSVSLQDQKAILSQGTYWDAQARIFQLEGGQYGNSANEISAVFIPVNTELSASLLADLNTSAYLDFKTPKTLERNPAIVAIYYIEPMGITRYYPNINLASLLPPDFDATKQPYYLLSSPLYDPKRLTQWTIPYVDAAGGGLVVTAASPVYAGGEFRGVVAADVQLSHVTQQVSTTKIGQSGYALMIDSAGRVISMPPAGYQMFGVNPEDLAADEFFKQTVLGNGPLDLRAITPRMASGGTGLNIIEVNGVDTYISYAPVKSTGYSLALVVPVSEMQAAITTAQGETENQIQSAIRLAAVIFTVLLFLAIILSFGVGRVIAAPVVGLTRTANQIVEGDLSARADIQSLDEIGILGQAFNTMTSRLRESLAGLEQRVQDRTSDLVAANEKIERRAKQFASISQISRVINQTQAMQDLLPQITQVISEQFGFYHVGIFLLDSNNENAMLVASNSEGGQRMLARAHKLIVGQMGIVGIVAGTGLPRIALDTGADASYFNNPDLPETHSEMALPLLRAGRQIIGVLDVQSVESNAFGQEDIQVLSTLAEQVSVAIANARLYEETQRALIEAETVYRGELRAGWQKFAKSLNLAGIRRRGTKSTLLSEPVDVPGLESVSRTGIAYEAQSEGNQKGSQITLPVKLRGEVVGVLHLRSEDNRVWTADELDIVNAIVERTALSIESSRLLSESQKQASKERIIGEISAKVSSYTNRENILQAAVTEIGRVMPGSEVSIQLQNKDGNGRLPSGEIR